MISFGFWKMPTDFVFFFLTYCLKVCINLFEYATAHMAKDLQSSLTVEKLYFAPFMYHLLKLSVWSCIMALVHQSPGLLPARLHSCGENRRKPPQFRHPLLKTSNRHIRMKESYDPRLIKKRRMIRGWIKSVVWSAAEYKAAYDSEPIIKRRMI